MLAANAYDIALIDIDMPGMGGIEMVRAMRSTPVLRDVPIVMVTGLEDILSIDQSYEAGATSFVTKPVNWRLLTYHLRFVLRSRESTRSDAIQGPDRAALNGTPGTKPRASTDFRLAPIRSSERADLSSANAGRERG